MVSRFIKIGTFFVTITQSFGAFSQTIQQDTRYSGVNKLEKASLGSLPSIRLWDWWFKQKEVKRSLMIQPQVQKESFKEIVAYNSLSEKAITKNNLVTANNGNVEKLQTTIQPQVQKESFKEIVAYNPLSEKSTTKNNLVIANNGSAEKSQTVVLMDDVALNTTVKKDSVVQNNVNTLYSSKEIIEAKPLNSTLVSSENSPPKMNQVIKKEITKTKLRVAYEPTNLLPENSLLHKRIVMRSGDKLSTSLRDFLLENDFELSWQVENGNGKARDYQLLERAVFTAADLNQVLEKIIEPFGLYAKVYEQEKIVVISNESNFVSSTGANN